MTERNEARKARTANEREKKREIEAETSPEFLAFINLAWPGLPRTSAWFGLAERAFVNGRLCERDPAAYLAASNEERERRIAEGR